MLTILGYKLFQGSRPAALQRVLDCNSENSCNLSSLVRFLKKVATTNWDHFVYCVKVKSIALVSRQENWTQILVKSGIRRRSKKKEKIEHSHAVTRRRLQFCVNLIDLYLSGNSCCRVDSWMSWLPRFLY